MKNGSPEDKNKWLHVINIFKELCSLYGLKHSLLEESETSIEICVRLQKIRSLEKDVMEAFQVILQEKLNEIYKESIRMEVRLSLKKYHFYFYSFSQEKISEDVEKKESIDTEKKTGWKSGLFNFIDRIKK